MKNMFQTTKQIRMRIANRMITFSIIRMMVLLLMGMLLVAMDMSLMLV